MNDRTELTVTFSFNDEEMERLRKMRQTGKVDQELMKMITEFFVMIVNNNPDMFTS